MDRFSPPPLRAPTACVACNKKKIRCIFEGKAKACLNCQRHQWPCLRRERKRKSRRAQNDAHIIRSPRQTAPNLGEDADESTARGSSRASQVLSSENPNDSCLLCSPDSRMDSGFSSTLSSGPGELSEQPCPLNPYSSDSRRSFMARSRYFEDMVVINEDQAGSYPTGDADGPNEDDIQILRLQGAFELPPRAIRDGLINTFMEKCSPWMPIIERSWLEESGTQKPSILLLQSVFVAASRVTSAPAVLAYASPHRFYRRAKALFWAGYEKNPVTVIAAVCILHWYNPEGPEHVSTNTSGFWRYVGVGLAHQIGLHKEPTSKRDAPLRRRLWWTLFARDCLISAGQGRPLAVNIDDCELASPRLEDFRDSSSNGDLFISYVEISSILGHLTQHCRRKSLTRQTRQDIENRLYRWTRDLPSSLRLFEHLTTPDENILPKRLRLARYNFEARQLHIPYFICLAIMCRPDPENSPSPAFILASSFVSGIFEDFLARDEIQFLGPIFTFHLLAAGIGLLSCHDIPPLWGKATDSLQTIYLSLEVLSAKWSSAKGSLRALRSIAEKQQNMGEKTCIDSPPIAREYLPFFDCFGPEISWAWSYFIGSSPPRDARGLMEVEPAVGIVQGASLDSLAEPHTDTLSSSMPSVDEYRPLTTILDPQAGYTMDDATRSIENDSFYNKYQGMMGDWLLRDLDSSWTGDIPW